MTQRLFELLPAVHRLRDAENGGLLRELMDLLEEQLAVLEEETAQRYDDQFIETCAAWVAPYLGDLIGYRVLGGTSPGLASPRAEVANTIAYRRRKGTAAVLEQLAHDVTSWPGARAVEYFERLATTQYLNHLRPHALATADLRDHSALAWGAVENAAFDDLAHTADVRRVAPAGARSLRGRHNVMNVGIFLWRVAPTRLTRVPMTGVGDGQRFRFDPLGADTQLFALPRTEESITHLAEPLDVPLALGVRWAADHAADYYGSGRSLLLELQTGAAAPEPVAVEDVSFCNLDDVPGGGGTWAHQPTPGRVAIDPVRGRAYLGTPVAAGRRVLATWHQGHALPIGAAGIGAGPVGRPPAELVEPVLRASAGANLQTPLSSLTAGGTLVVEDFEEYPQSLTIATTTAPLGASDTRLRLVAADQARPSLVAATDVRLELDPRTTVVLDGLLLSGGPVVLPESADTETRTVILRNCTLVPGHGRTEDGRPTRPERASLFVLHPFAEVLIERCVLGPIVAVEGAKVHVVDSAIDAGDRAAVAVCGRPPVSGGLRDVTSVADMEVGDGLTPAGDVELDQVTVIGGIHAVVLDASNSILLADLAPGDPRLAGVWARRRQVGCLRYSYVPEGSRTGRRYRCQPDPETSAETRRGTRPFFTSLRFGHPAYLQLSVTTPRAIRAGSEDEDEMGATRLLYATRREANLTTRLEEYLRFGLEAGIFYAT